MKYILGFLAGSVGALFVLIILSGIASLFNFTIPEFLIGWMSCIGFTTGMKIYQIMKEINLTQE